MLTKTITKSLMQAVLCPQINWDPPPLRAAGSASHPPTPPKKPVANKAPVVLPQLQQQGRNSPTRVKRSPPPHSPRTPPLTGARARQQPLVQHSQEERLQPQAQRRGKRPCSSCLMRGGGRGGRRDWREQPKPALPSPEAGGLLPAATAVLGWRGMPSLHIRAGFLVYLPL